MDYSRRHLRFGWWSLLVFASAGLLLESLQGFKVRAYVDTSNETRRLMWTLAHAHGALLALVNVAAGLAWRSAPSMPQHPRLISSSLLAASVLLPGGFFLGGVAFYGGDPGVGTLLVPVGAVLLLFAIFSIARAASASR
jgi:hypothetical protein